VTSQLLLWANLLQYKVRLQKVKRRDIKLAMKVLTFLPPAISLFRRQSHGSESMCAIFIHERFKILITCNVDMVGGS
jgi:hypothetical protein